MTLILGEGGFIKKFIQPLGPQLGLKISRGGDRPPRVGGCCAGHRQSSYCQSSTIPPPECLGQYYMAQG